MRGWSRSLFVLLAIFNVTEGFSPSRVVAVRPAPQLWSTITEEESPILIGVDTLEEGTKKKQGILAQLSEKIGFIDESRLEYPEYDSREVPRMFSRLSYQKREGGSVQAIHKEGSVLAATALVVASTLGAGFVALPTATAATGFVPSTTAMIPAFVYMVMSGLLIAELKLNRILETGRPRHELLQIYEDNLTGPLKKLGVGAYFFLQYTMMVALLGIGGESIASLAGMQGDPLAGEALLAFIAASASVFLNKNARDAVVTGLLLGTMGLYGVIMANGIPSVDWLGLLSFENQHPDQVLNCLPILFASLIFQNAVPEVVTQLEGDRTKITQAIVAGTGFPLLLFLAWNAMVLGNWYEMGAVTDPLMVIAGNPLFLALSSVAVLMSTLGFSSSLQDGIQVSAASALPRDETIRKPLLAALAFLPPLAALSMGQDVGENALVYAGAFGVSTLFFVLTPIMVWNQRYTATEKPLITKPLVPFGKIPLGSMWKTAGTLILEQGLEKLGVFEYIQEHFLH